MKKLSNLKISRKLIIGFVAVALIAVFIGGVGLSSIQRLQNVDALLFEQNLGGMGYTGDAYGNFQGLRYALVKYNLGTAAGDKEAALKNIQESITTIDSLMKDYSELANISNPDIYAQLESNNTNWNSIKENMQKVAELIGAGKHADAASYFEKVDELGTVLADGLSNLMMLNFLDAQTRSDSNNAVATTATVSFVVICVFGVAFSVVLGLVLSSNIGKPVAYAVEIANLLAVGNVDLEKLRGNDAEALKARKDEIGELARAFSKLIIVTVQQANLIKQIEQGDLTAAVEVRSENDVLGKSLSGLVSNLSNVVSGIISVSGQVASGAQLVADSSMTLSQGATEQASSIEELTTSLEEISSQTALNAQNAEKASDLAIKAKKEAEQGNAQMNTLLKAMDAINASSSNINKIIKVIDDIAFQTNILALNAAVEAARAGQHGKGFAVVAEEVRTLASKSANAVKDTTEMIDDSIRNVESGIRIANETADALKRIVSEVSSATELVESIAISSKEQAQGIEQLNHGIVEVSQVVQNTAATSEECAAASEELSGQANQLNNVVSIFKIKNGSLNNPSMLSTASAIAPSQVRALLSGNSHMEIAFDDDFGKY